MRRIGLPLSGDGGWTSRTRMRTPSMVLTRKSRRVSGAGGRVGEVGEASAAAIGVLTRLNNVTLLEIGMDGSLESACGPRPAGSPPGAKVYRLAARTRDHYDAKCFAAG